MTRVCFFCRRALPANESLEQFPVGRRVAYDPVRGRLWAVCPACARWNLAPIEERWEALEELEKLARDRARLLAQTEIIGLLRAGPLDVVRVGRADLREEAWWRYGRELARRRGRRLRLLAFDVALTLTLGAPFLRDVLRGYTFRNGADTGLRRCDRCGASLSGGALSLRKARQLRLERDADGNPRLALACPYCDLRGEEGGTVWGGAEARQIVRTVMAYENFDGGTPGQIDDACGRIATLGSARRLVTEVAGWGLPLAQLRFPTRGGLLQDQPQYARLLLKPSSAALAVEISVNEEHERALLTGEAAALEARWREEEAIAAIVDRELTPLPEAPRSEGGA